MRLRDCHRPLDAYSASRRFPPVRLQPNAAPEFGCGRASQSPNPTTDKCDHRKPTSQQKPVGCMNT
jgi:hypothetical protein